MNTGERIKQLREERGLTQTELAQKIGYSDRSSVARIEAGKMDLTTRRVKEFAEALGVDTAKLMGREFYYESGEVPDFVRRAEFVPLLGPIACGEPILAQENYDETVVLPKGVKADFALRCKGDSMVNARIYDGDIVYIRQQPTVDNGEIAAVLIDNEATLKRVHIYSDHAILTPENPEYKPMLFWGEDMNNMRILGKAVGFTSFME